MAEHQIVDLDVAGSSPVKRPKHEYEHMARKSYSVCKVHLEHRKRHRLILADGRCRFLLVQKAVSLLSVSAQQDIPHQQYSCVCAQMLVGRQS